MKSSDDHSKPSILKKIVSGANWGMLAGFWVELPLMAAFLVKPFKPKDLTEWAKVSEWSVKLVLPTTLVGVIYGFMKPSREYAALKHEAEVLKSSELWPLSERSEKSWVEREQARQQSDEHIKL